MPEGETHIYLTPVRADQAEDFERFLREVAHPTALAQRPELAHRYKVLRPTRAGGSDGEVLTYALVFEGGDLDNDWDLGRLLEERHGEEEGRRLLERWVGTFASARQWAAALPVGDEPTQVGWTFTQVSLEE